MDGDKITSVKESFDPNVFPTKIFSSTFFDQSFVRMQKKSGNLMFLQIVFWSNADQITL